MYRLICSFLLVLLSANFAFAITPIARFDLVPYQRIEYGQTLNVGVVAFSKPGIASVVFTITGQGYSGGTKTTTAMTLNTQLASTVSGYDGVYEYWVPLASSEFTGNGPITISAAVTDNDSNVRNITAIPLIVEGVSAFNHVSAWVDATGSDGNGTVGNVNDPFPTIASAVAAAQTANGGVSDGNIIYIENGTYSIDAVTGVNTSYDYLTITRSAAASKESVIINEGRPSFSPLLKVSGITLQSTGGGQTVIHGADADYLWIDDCRIIGSGRHVTNSSPVLLSTSAWATDTYVFDADYGFYRANLVRNTALEQIGNDAFQNTEFIVNTSLTNISNGPNPSWHADSYQAHTTGVPPASNRIIYNYTVTDARYQGIYLRSDGGIASDNAFVNVLVEMREVPDLNETGNYAFTPLSINQEWDHLLVWNCTFPYGGVSRYGTITNSSFVGNYFWQWRDSDTSWLSTGASEAYGNHFENVYGVTPACTPTTKDVLESASCPRADSKQFGTNATTGNGVLSVDFRPLAESILLDRFTPVVTADIDNTGRGALSDIGIYEFIPTTTPQASRNLGVLGWNGAYYRVD